MKKMSYDEAMHRLEEIAALLENEQTPIEESLELYKEGISLTAFCQKKLQEIEQEMTVIQAAAKEQQDHDAK